MRSVALSSPNRLRRGQRRPPMRRIRPHAQRRFAFALTRKDAASYGDKPSLISWRQFCAEGDRTQGCAKRIAFGDDPRGVALDFNILPRPRFRRRNRWRNPISTLLSVCRRDAKRVRLMPMRSRACRFPSESISVIARERSDEAIQTELRQPRLGWFLRHARSNPRLSFRGLVWIAHMGIFRSRGNSACHFVSFECRRSGPSLFS